MTFGMVGARPVFMDARDDSYFMLQPADEAEFLELVRRKGRIGAPLRLALGLTEQVSWPEPACSLQPRSSLLDGLPLHGCDGPMDVLRVALALRSARRMLRTQPIQAVLGSVAQVRSVGEPAEARLIAAASRFLSARVYVPAKRSCLTDSLALMRFLGTLAVGATLVFGVKLEPFGAHCWVQFEQLLLNDRSDHVERFVPVRTVTCLPATR